MKFKSRSLLVAALVSPLAMGSFVLADNITFTEVNNGISAFAEIDGLESTGDAAGDITIDPFDGEANAFVESGEGTADATGYQYTEWSSNSFTSSASLFTTYENFGPPQDFYTQVTSGFDARFTANENVMYTLSISMYGLNYEGGYDNTAGLLYNVTTATTVHAWELSDVGGTGSLSFEGTLSAGDQYRLEIVGLSRSPIFEESFAAGDDYWSGYTSFAVDFSTMIPLPSAGLAGLMGLGWVVGMPRRRRFASLT